MPITEEDSNIIKKCMVQICHLSREERCEDQLKHKVVNRLYTELPELKRE